MDYEKPVVVDLGATARSAAGQDPLGCFNGSANAGTCATGPSVESGREGCRLGTSASIGVCAAGNSPGGSQTRCAYGGSGTLDDCNAGSLFC